jgi:glycosyl transferase family 25
MTEAIKNNKNPFEHSLQTFVINLKDATERWHHMKEALDKVGLGYTRIDAVLGKNLEEPIVEFNERRYNILTGKHKSHGEIGCYLSHIKALTEFLISDSDYALILEDDVTLPEHLPELITEAINRNQHWDLLRLSSSRDGEYIKIANMSFDSKLAYNTKVLKNTGAYVINLKAAQACVDEMFPMCLPYDVALDRDWDYGFKTACIIPFPVVCEDFATQINKAKRIRRYRSTTFHLYHLLSRIQRIKYRKKCAHEAKKYQA